MKNEEKIRGMLPVLKITNTRDKRMKKRGRKDEERRGTQAITESTARQEEGMKE